MLGKWRFSSGECPSDKHCLETNHQYFVSVQLNRTALLWGRNIVLTAMNDVGELTAIKAPNVDIRERVCGEHRPILLKGSEPSSEPFFWF